MEQVGWLMRGATCGGVHDDAMVSSVGAETIVTELREWASVESEDGLNEGICI